MVHGSPLLNFSTSKIETTADLDLSPIPIETPLGIHAQLINLADGDGTDPGRPL